MKVEKKWYSAEEVCEYLGISFATLRNYCIAGLPCATPRGQKRFFYIPDVDKWMREQRTLPKKKVKQCLQ